MTAGFRCAPETLPMKRMIPITMSPGATTAACLLIVSGKAWLIISAACGDQNEEERAEPARMRDGATPALGFLKVGPSDPRLTRPRNYRSERATRRRS